MGVFPCWYSCLHFPSCWLVPSPAQAIIIITVPRCPCDTGAVVVALLIKIPGVPSPCYAVCDISHWDAAALCQVSQQNLLTQHTRDRFILNNKVFAFDPGIKWLVTVNMWFISLKYQVITRSTLHKGLVSLKASPSYYIYLVNNIIFLHYMDSWTKILITWKYYLGNI